MGDAAGGNLMGDAAVRRLEDAGCKFDTYRPKRLRNIGVLNERDHRKIVALDGRTAPVGRARHGCIAASSGPKTNPERKSRPSRSGPSVTQTSKLGHQAQ
jgi:hypothetical protein